MQCSTARMWNHQRLGPVNMPCRHPHGAHMGRLWDNTCAFGVVRTLHSVFARNTPCRHPHGAHMGRLWNNISTGKRKGVSISDMHMVAITSVDTVTVFPGCDEFNMNHTFGMDRHHTFRMDGLHTFGMDGLHTFGMDGHVLSDFPSNNCQCYSNLHNQHPHSLILLSGRAPLYTGTIG